MEKIDEIRAKLGKFENGQLLEKSSFKFLSQLGAGSFGKVYKVKSNESNNVYALKVLSKNQLTSLKLLS